MRFRELAKVAALLLLAPIPVHADHIPEQLHATGEAETKLAGLSITRSGVSVSKAIELFGEPTEKKVAPNNPVWVGYLWKLEKTTLEVGTANGKITDIYVAGAAEGTPARTGAGLKLGDGLDRLKALYGPKFEDRVYPDMHEIMHRSDRAPYSGIWENRRVTIQWASPEYTLTAGLDERGRIVSLWLLRPECFPGECE